MSQSSNTASVKDTNTEKLFVSTNSNDATKLELQALKALVRDNIRDENGNVLPIAGDLSGTGTDLEYDFHTVNMINQDVFSSQIHIVHTTYEQRANDVDASYINVSLGSLDISSIEIDETTAAFVEGNLILDICNGADDISLSNALLGTNKHNLKFTSADLNTKSFTKALLAATDNDDTSLLFSVVEDPSNASNIILNKGTDPELVGASAKFDVILDTTNATALSALPSQISAGTYNIRVEQTNSVAVTASPNINDIGMRTLSGDTLNDTYYGATNLLHFLPEGAEEVPGYTIDISLSKSGNIESENSAFKVDNFANMANNLDYMNAIRDFGNNKNTLDSSATLFLAYKDVSSHNILITNSVTDLSFGESNNIEYTNGTGGTFKVSINDTQDEFLENVSQGEVKLFSRPDTERLLVTNNVDVSNIITASIVRYVGDVSINNTFVDLCLNSTESVNYTLKQKFPNAGSSLLTSQCLSGGNAANALVIKDDSSTLFNNDEVDVTFVDGEISTLQAANNLTFIKVEDVNKFATRVNKIFDLCNTDISFGNPDVQISVTGENVQLDIDGLYNYDQVRLFLEPKTLANIQSEGLVDNVNSDGSLKFTTSDDKAELKTKADFSRPLNEFTWNVLDQGTSLDMSFDVVANYEGDISAHEFQSKIQTLFKKQWTSNGILKEDIDYPEDYTLTLVDTIEDTNTYLTTHGSGRVHEIIKHTKNKITDPFYLGAYHNLQAVVGDIEIKDTFYEYYHSDGTKGPESKLRNYTTNAAKREITFTPQTRTITKSMLHSMKGQLQGRNKDTEIFDTTELRYDIDLVFNEATTINGFNSDANATFIVNLDLDQGDVSLNSTHYAILLDFAEGNAVWNLSKKTGTLSSMVDGLTSLQDIFDASDFTTDISLSSLHNVDDNTGKNTLTLKNDDNTFCTIEGDRTLLANFVVVVSNGPVFQVLRNGADISFDTYMYTETTILDIDNGIRLTIEPDQVNFGGVDISLSLQKDIVGVAHYDTNALDMSGVVLASKTYTDASAQDIVFNNYRGIIEDQTIQIRRVGGQFQLDFAGSVRNSIGDLLAGTATDVSMTGFGDLGYDITSEVSHLGTSNPLSSTLTTPLTLTPAQYILNGRIIGSDVSLQNKTSFSDVLFDFYDASSGVSNRTDGIFKSSLIADGADRYTLVSNDGGTYSVNHNGVQIATASNDFSDIAEDNELVFNDVRFPFITILKQTIATDVDVSFTLSVPKYKVQYRNSTGVTNFPHSGNAADNTTTEFLSAGIQSHELADIEATLRLDTNKTFIDFATNPSNDVFSTDMTGNSNTIRAQVTYDTAINPSINDEFLVIPNSGTDTSSVAVTIDKIAKSGRYYELAMTQTADGLYTTYDVCSNLVNSAANILIKIPSAYINEGRYQSVITPNVGVKTSLIGAEYVLDGDVPVIKVRKYTSPIHESFETFKIDKNQVRAAGFRANTIEEAIIPLTTATFGSTAYSFQSILNTTANNLFSVPAYAVLNKVDISNENIWDDYANNKLNYVMVPLTFAGIGNIFEVTSTNISQPVKTLVSSTPDITRITSADGAPVFRVRANGRIDTGTVQTANLISVDSQTSNSGSSYNKEFVSYNVLLG